jgi:hypothetical protein
MWQNGGWGVKAAISIGCRNAVITNWFPKFAKTAIQHACSPISLNKRARKPEKGKSGWCSAKQNQQKTDQ